MVTNNVLVFIFLCGITFAIQNLKSGTFDHETADFLIPHTDVKVLLNLREIACLAKCLSVDICQAAAVAKMTEDRESQACGLLLYQEGSNATVRNSISLQYMQDISAIWIKSNITGRRTAEGTSTHMNDDSETGTTRGLVTCDAPFNYHKSGCYLAGFDHLFTWQEAENYCQTLGKNVHLVRPDTEEKRTEAGSLTTQAFWIGANDTNGDNTIRYLGDGGAIIPDDSPLWSLPPRHLFEGIHYDCVEVSSWKFMLLPCNIEKDFICELYQ